MEKVNCALAAGSGVFLAEFVGPAKGVRPIDGYVNQQAFSQILLNQSKGRTLIARGDFLLAHRVAKRIADFDTMQWREKERLRDA